MLRKLIFITGISLLVVAGCDTAYSPSAGENNVNVADLAQPAADESSFPDFRGMKGINGSVVDEADIESLSKIGYGPVMENDAGLRLEDFGFRNVRHARLLGTGWIESTTPGGTVETTYYRTPEFKELSRNLAYGLELRYKVQFPSAVTTSPEGYKENNAFMVRILDSRGDTKYALLYKPNVSGTEQSPDIVVYLGDPSAPSVRTVPITTGRFAPAGNPRSHVAIRLVLKPVAEAGGDGEIGLYFDASDGAGAVFYPVATDDSGVNFTSLAFSYVTGTGAETFRSVMLGLQFKLWRIPFEPGDQPLPQKVIVPGDFRTQTQGGWGLPPFRNNAGAYRNRNFAAAFPDGIEIGIPGPKGKSIKFTKSYMIQFFLPEGGRPAVLHRDLTNPFYMHNTLAGQVLALALNIGFDLHDPAFGASPANMKDLVVVSGPFRDWTVWKVYAEANTVLGGGNSTYIPAQVNDAVASINANFIGGKVVGPFLRLP